MIAWRYFRTRKKSGVISLTSMITVIGVFLGTLAILISMSVLNGFQNIVFERARDMEPHFRIDMRHIQAARREKFQQFLFSDSTDGLLSAAVMERKLLIHHNGENRVVLVRGVKPDAYKKIINIDRYLFNKQFLTDDIEKTEMPEIIIGVSIANHLGLHTGDTLSLVNILAADKGLPPTISCRIKDVFQVDIFDYDLTTAFIHIEDMRFLLDDPGEDFIDFRVIGGSEEQINALIPSEFKDLIVLWQDEHRELFTAMNIEKTGSFLVLNLIILLAGFNLIASLMLLLLEKRWESGMLRAMGLRTIDTIKIYFYLGWINSGLGMALGLGIALPFLWIQQHYPFIPLPQDVYFIRWLPVELHLTDVMSTIITLSIIISISSLIPALRVNKEKPLNALKEKN